MHATPPTKQAPPPEDGHPPVRRRWRRTAAIAPIAVAGLLAAAQPALAASQLTHHKPPAARTNLISGTAGLPHEPHGTGSESAITGGALFGGNTPLTTQTSKLGRRLAIVRVYDHIGDTFPGTARTFLGAGTTALVSMDSNGTSYAAIAAGKKDPAIRSFLTEVNQTAIRDSLPAIYVTFEHEPDGSEHHSLGTPAQFVKAWDHIHQLATGAHLNWRTGGRLHWVWIMLHSSFSTGLASQYWPGADEVAGIGVDGYNSLACRLASPRHVTPLQRTLYSPAAIFDPAIQFAQSKARGGVPVFVSEWGSDGSPATQTSFIRQMRSYVASNPEIVAALYWDSNGPTCHYSIGRDSPLTALAAMGRSRALQGHLITLRPGCPPGPIIATQETASAKPASTGPAEQFACPFIPAPTPIWAACSRSGSLASASGIACAQTFRLYAKSAAKSPRHSTSGS